MYVYVRVYVCVCIVLYNRSTVSNKTTMTTFVPVAPGLGTYNREPLENDITLECRRGADDANATAAVSMSVSGAGSDGCSCQGFMAAGSGVACNVPGGA